MILTCHSFQNQSRAEETINRYDERLRIYQIVLAGLMLETIAGIFSTRADRDFKSNSAELLKG
jgi:hypothetical protein